MAQSHLVVLGWTNQGDWCEVGITSIKTPQMDHPLVDELRESFVHGGFTEEDWDDLVNRPNLPDWSIRWSGVTHRIIQKK